MRLLPIAGLLFLLSACGGGGGGTASAPMPGPALAVDTASNLGPIAPQLFGVNTPWEDSGQGLALGGELLQDRSFRSFGTAGSPWLGLPGNGAVQIQSTGGDASPQGGVAYAGCLQLNGGPGTSDLVGAAQMLLGPLKSGTTYTLCCSTYAEGPQTPALQAALAQASPFVAVASVSDTTTVGAWKRHRLSLTPNQDVSGALLSLAIQGPGIVRLDEVRLSASPDGPATVDPLLAARLAALGVKGLRWPGGTLADSFDWRVSVGAILARGENLATGGRHQTPVLGLDEFLRFCESAGLEPLLQVNVLAGSASAADLVQYCNGAATTPMGALRAANGHAAPYHVLRFELGNEPAAGYGDGATYASMAAPIADAMKSVDMTIQLSGIMETSFQQADWLATAPLLAFWNSEALALASRSSFLHGHYYSYFDTDADPAMRFRRLMAAGTVLRRTRDGLAAQSALPLWITEYHVDLQSAGTLQPTYLVDAASGLAVADELMTMLQGGFGGAHAWNLSEASGFGLLAHPGAWDARPAGLAFQLLAPFAGETRLSASLSGIGTYALGAGKGNIPSNTSYPLVAALASKRSSGHLRVALLNRSWDQPQSLGLPLSGAATLTWLKPADLSATNEGAIQVQLSVESRTFAAGDVLVLPPHSLVRIDL